jgi:hypothetical protein
MQNTNKQKSIIIEFQTVFNALSVDAKAFMRFNIINKCGFSYSTFYYKLRNGNFVATEITVLRKELHKSNVLNNTLV